MKGILLTSSFCLLHNVLVRADDILVHLSFHLFLYRRDSQHSAHQFHLQDALLLLLGKIIDAVGLVELVIGFISPCIT